MIYADLSTNNIHYIDYKGVKMFPDAIIILPIKNHETLNIETDFTCLFTVHNFPSLDLKPLSLEYYTDKNEINFNEYSFKGVYPNWVYIFKGRLDLDYFENHYFNKD